MSDVAQKLIIQAEGVGLPETARGLDVVRLAQERLVEVNEQLEKARLTGTLDDVEALAKHQQKLERAISSMTGEQEKATEAKVSFGEQLRKIHPLLGDVAGAVTKYGGAASVAGAAIAAFTMAIRTMRDELQKAQASINATAQAMNQIKAKERDDQQSIENIRAGTRLGSFQTPEQSIAAIERANRIRKSHGFLDSASVNEAAALASGGSFTDDETARIARMMEIPAMRNSLNITEKTSAANIERRLRKGLDKFGPELDTTFRLEEEQKYLGKAMAGPQARQQGGASLDLQEIITRRAPAGANIEFLTSLAQRFGGLGPLEEYAAKLEKAQSGESPFMHIGMRVGQVLSGMGVVDDPRIQATPADLAVLRGVFVEMRQRQNAKKISPQQPPPAPNTPEPIEFRNGQPSHLVPMEPHSSTVQPGASSSTYIDQRSYNARHFGRDARSQRRRITNGGTLARRMEMV